MHLKKKTILLLVVVLFTTTTTTTIRDDDNYILETNIPKSFFSNTRFLIKKWTIRVRALFLFIQTHPK